MKSFEFNFYQENLFYFNEEKTLLDSSSYENKHQNDTAEWYEKLNEVSYDYREKLYRKFLTFFYFFKIKDCLK